MNLVDPSFELIDPTPNIHELFVSFSDQLFYGALGACTVNWSKKMTRCAGVCSFNNKTGFCEIRLSEPLLKLRSRKDLIETLLHEMIHAYLFITQRVQDRDGHGSDFQKHMHRINVVAGTNITIYHSFHAEVAVYKQHWWRCNGRCKERSPFFGWIKRSINRPPGPNDFWWSKHQQTCSGTFVKIKEPIIKSNNTTFCNTKTNIKKKLLKNSKNEKQIKINSLFSNAGELDSFKLLQINLNCLERQNCLKNTTSDTSKTFFSGKGYFLGSKKNSSLEADCIFLNSNQDKNNYNNNKKVIDIICID